MVRIDRAQLQPWRGLRLALGVAVPLVVGAAVGHADFGMFASAGALGVGFGSFLGMYRTQAGTMLAAAVAIGLSLFVGSVGGHATPVLAGLVLLWGFGAGLLGVFGPASYFVGLQSVLNLLLGSGFPTAPHDAALRAVAALAGGVLQTLLVIGVWPLRRFVAERAALADAYRLLAHYLSDSSATRAPPPSLAARGIHAVLADPYPFAAHRDVSTLQRLLDEAEQIRVSVAAMPVSDAMRRATNDAAARVRAAAAAVLAEIADAVQAGRAPAGCDEAWRVLQSAGPAEAAPGVRSVRDLPVRRLLGQLRAAWRVATDGAGDEASARPERPRAMRGRALRNGARTLRAALTMRSSAFRHALRIAIAVALATVLARATNLANGYWLPIAVLLVLQPGFGDTLARGLGMMAGTVAGALVATTIAALARPAPWTLTLLLAVIAWLCFTTFRANYALFAACITAYVVFLVSFFGLPEPVAALHRVLATLAGGALALAAYALWPTREARLVPERLAAALTAQGRYAATLLVQIAAPDTRNDAALAKARLRAQLERSNAEESVERMLYEPGAHVLPSSTALGMLAALRTFALAGLVLDGARTGAACPAWPRLRVLAQGIEHGLARTAAALRAGGPPRPLPPLRALHARLAGEVPVHERAASANGGECASLRRLALSETDLMVDSVDSIASLARPSARMPPAR